MPILIRFARSIPAHRLLASAIVAVPALVAQPTRAGDFIWDGQFNGLWDFAAVMPAPLVYTNWNIEPTPVTPYLPAAADTVTFTGTTPNNTIDLVGIARPVAAATFNGGGVFSLANGRLETSGDTLIHGLAETTLASDADLWLKNNLTVSDAELSTSADSRVQVGDAAYVGSSSGTLSIGDADAGGSSGGHLYVQNRGRLIHRSNADLGSKSHEYGYATVTGAGSAWTNSGSLSVGYYGTGTLNIKDGGQVSNTTGYLGRNAGSTGQATVTGANSTWTNSDFLYVGYTGTLYVEAGGSVSSRASSIGSDTGSIGQATVTGSGSQWNNALSMQIGDSGTGTLNIQGGGSVLVGGGLVMQRSGGTATLNFTLASLADPLVDVMGDAWLKGTLSVTLDAGLTLTAGNAFTLIDIGGARKGTFSNVIQNERLGTFNGIDLFLTYTGGDGNDVVAYTIAPLPGDTDGDGDIDDSDLGTSFSNYTGPLTPGTGNKTAAQGDTDGDGDVDDSDLGTSFSGYTGPLAVNVPEPTALALIGLGGLALGRRRRAV